MSGKAKIVAVAAKNASNSEPAKPINPVQGCPNNNWIELVYKYNSKRAVSGANFEVFDAGTNQSLATGCLDNMGFARVDGLPDNVRNVNFLFSSDPKPFEIYPGYKPKPHNLTPESTEVEKEDGTVVSVAKWVGVALAGDFADDQSFGQIAFGTVVTLIPVVDQVGDVRDIIANLHRLTWRKQYNEFSPWFSLVVTVIGCVPEIGSIIKGVVKSLFGAIKKGAKRLPLTKLIRLLNSVGEGNVIKFLRQFLDKIAVHGADVAEKILKMLEKLKSKFENLRHVTFGKAEKMIDELLESIEKVYKQTPGMVQKVIGWIAEHLKNTLDEVTDFTMKGVTKIRNGARQLEEKLLKKTAESLESIARRAGMKEDQISKLAAHCKSKERMVVVRVSNPDSLKFQGQTFKVETRMADKAELIGKEVNYLPKPLDVKLKTGKGDGVAEELKGLVIKPTEPMAKWERENIAELEKKGYWFDENGLLHDKNGNAFHGDYDVQSVQSKVKIKNEETGEWEDAYVNEFSNPEDGVSVIEDMNKDVMGDVPADKRVFQHGAEGDYRVKLDEKGNVVKVDDKGNVVTEGGHAKSVGADDLNTGGRGGSQMQAGKDYKLGRQYGQDEKYLVVDSDGSVRVAESPEELKSIYNEAGLPWEYDPTPAKANAAIANTVNSANRAAQSNNSQNNR